MFECKLSPKAQYKSGNAFQRDYLSLSSTCGDFNKKVYGFLTDTAEKNSSTLYENGAKREICYVPA